MPQRKEPEGSWGWVELKGSLAVTSKSRRLGERRKATTGVSEHSDGEFYFLKIIIIIKLKKKKKEKRGGHMIKCLLTELGRAGRENIWPSVIAHGPRCARSVRYDLGPNIFPYGPPSQSISTY